MKAPLLLISSLAFAASPQFWEMTSFQDFSKGRLQGLALSSEGRLTLAPALKLAFSSEQPVVWAVTQTPAGDTYIATGHRGRLYRLRGNAQPELVFTAPEPEIFAVTADAKGIVYAGTSPQGKIYRIENGQATPYFDPKSRYIWSLAAAKDGTLYAGTGDDGKVYQITAANTGSIYFESGQSHITALALDSQARLLAGSEPNGLLYRITAKDKAFVLYDANYPEIRAIVPMPDGSVYAAAMGGAVTKQSQSQAGATPTVSSTITVTAPATTITVEGANAQNPPGIDVKPKQTQQTSTTATQQAATPTPVVEYAGVEKSAIYRINPDNTVDTLWSSKEENAYDLTPQGDALLFGTDQKGRVYRLGKDRKTGLIAETGENQILRIAPTPAGLLLATGDLGKLFRLDPNPQATGQFESPVHDATTTARWGRVSWSGAGTIAVRTRTGNSARPDKTWSDWSAPLQDKVGSPIASPNARYIQFQATLNSPTATLDSIRLAYLPQNTPPNLKSITVSAQTASAGSKPAAVSGAQASPVYSVTVTDTGEAGASSVSGTSTQPVTRASVEQIVITWAADDPEQDKLIFALEFRGEGETIWKPLKANFTEATYTLDAETLADGRYFFKVNASDRLANPEPYARTAEITSAPILIDRTPPVIRVTAQQLPEIRFTAQDASSPLKSCEYSLDATPWTPLAPTDGVLDSPQEDFAIHLTPAPGEHMLVLRCYDTANNAGLAKLILPAR